MYVISNAKLPRVPPNCRFEIDDFEQPWSYSKPFDYIHGRELAGAIRDHEKLFAQAFENLKPNGWFEMATMEPATFSDDGTHLKATCLVEAVKYIQLSSKMFGKESDAASTWKGIMEKAGFINVHEVVYKVSISRPIVKSPDAKFSGQLPQSPWPKDPKFKELGKYHQLNMLEAMPPYTYALFTRMLGWPRHEIEALLAGVRRELKDLSNHLYTRVYMVYGQKPE